ncbi:MAG: hypothetical protein PHT33_02865 [bacterium]|nr:hypothetical protein [bacterium]
MKRAAILILLLSIFATFAIADTCQAVQLRYNFSQGSKYAYGLWLDADIKFSAKSAGQDTALSAKLNGYTDVMQSINKVTDRNTAVIETRLENIQGKISFMGQEMPLPADMAKKIQEAINPIIQEMDRRGKTVSLSMPSLEKFLQEMMKSGTNPAKGIIPVTPLSEMSKHLAESPSPLPEGDIQPGYTWDSVSKVPTPDGKTMEIAVRNTFKGVTEVEGKACYVIESAMDLPLGNLLPASTEATKGMKMDGSVSVKSQTCHEASNMMPMRTEATMSMKMNVNMNMSISSDATKIDASVKVLMNRRQD